jgi:hypothetical protein
MIIDSQSLASTVLASDMLSVPSNSEDAENEVAGGTGFKFFKRVLYRLVLVSQTESEAKGGAGNDNAAVTPQDQGRPKLCPAPSIPSKSGQGQKRQRGDVDDDTNEINRNPSDSEGSKIPCLSIFEA